MEQPAEEDVELAGIEVEIHAWALFVGNVLAVMGRWGLRIADGPRITVGARWEMQQ